jgi:phenylacetate-coenzyme A ligase PaaK-like adenylate-forming protein
MNIPGTNPPNKRKEALNEMRSFVKDVIENWDAYREHLEFQAKSAKAFYDSLISQGFTEKQALEIVKNRSM